MAEQGPSAGCLVCLCSLETPGYAVSALLQCNLSMASPAFCPALKMAPVWMALEVRPFL